jgi:hypothetical protein
LLWASLKLAAIGHQQVADAYFLALAVHHGGKLATLTSVSETSSFQK